MGIDLRVDEQCALILTKSESGGMKISLINVPAKGKESHLMHHAIRDVVKFLHGRPANEFDCEYKEIPKRRHLILVEGEAP